MLAFIDKFVIDQGPVESKIPVFSRKPISSRISRPFATLSNRVLAHLNPVDSKSNDKHRPGSPSSVILGILNAGSSSRKSRSDSVGSVDSTKTDYSNESTQQINSSDVGKRVTLSVSCEKVGTLHFVGATQFGGGIWCGIELDAPEGLNDGSVGNTRYFTCKPHHGIFAPVEKVKLIKSSNDIGGESEPLSLEDIERSAAEHLDHVALKSNMTLDFTHNTKNPSEHVETPEGFYQPEWAVGSHQSSSIQQDLSHLNLGISKHNSLDLDESLGILTPDQMTDFTMTDESFHRTISCEGITNLMPEFKADMSSSNLKVSDHLLSDVTNLESTPVEDITMSGIMELDDCLSSKSEYLLMNNRDLAGSLETSSSYYIENEKNNQVGMNCLVERTPSFEDLPMDGIITQEHNHSDGPSNSTCSAQLIPNPNSFITSVTSIASLDNGYQGDGELSRPTSRGADHSPTAHQNVKLKVIDSMTDSDFFTESDADVHEDLGRGDRRAQVIDGIIYGGLPNQSPNTQRRKSGTHSQIMEEMESSGVYSDLERKIEDQFDCTLKPLAENLDQKMESCDDQSAIITELIHDTSPSEASTNMDETGASTETLQNASSPDLKKNEPNKAGKKSKTDVSNKKFKMPNRNVTSKVKSMISSAPPIRKTPDDEMQENRKPRPNKKGKWDAVMDKIAQGQTEKKTQPRLKEVKSKVFAQITANAPDSVASNKRSNQKEFPLSHSTSTRSLRETTETKAKKRTRVRSSELSTQSAGTCRSHASQNSSRNSSVTDLSEQNSAKISSSSSSTYTRSIKKQNGGGGTGVSSPVSDETSGGAKLTLPRLKEAITSRSTSSINSIQNKSSTKDGKSNTKTNASRKQLIRPLRDHGSTHHNEDLADREMPEMPEWHATTHHQD
ncbi:hypothetical protein M8J75_013830 [Diaphorina citri]|nr:hypothetical protein M8J75_013830 [Diaphorina citri]